MRGIVILTGSVAATLGTAAHARPVVDWTGFYIGATAGGSSSTLDASSTDAIQQLTNVNPVGPEPLTVVPGTTRSISAKESDTNFLYGGVAGFQLQSVQWVFGVEGELNGPRDMASVASSQSLPATILMVPGTVDIARMARSEYDWSARARIGYAFGANLLYATGGVAGAEISLKGVDTLTYPAGASAAGQAAGYPAFNLPAVGPAVYTSTAKDSVIGWTAGVGGEHRIGQMLGIGLEARYTDLGSHTIQLPGCVYNSAATGQCPGATFTGPDLVFPAGTTPVAQTATGVETYPNAIPGNTAISLTDWRVTARVTLHFDFGG